MPVTRLPLPGVTVNDSDAGRDGCGISGRPGKSGAGALNTVDGEGTPWADAAVGAEDAGVGEVAPKGAACGEAGIWVGDGGAEMSWRVGSMAAAGSVPCPNGAEGVEGAANVNVLAVGSAEIFSDTFSDEFSLKSIPKSMACSIVGWEAEGSFLGMF